MFMVTRENDEPLIASVSLAKENEVQTEESEFTEPRRLVLVRRAWICCSNKQLQKICCLKLQRLILIHVKSFTGPTGSPGGCPLYVSSTFQAILVSWHCAIDTDFHAGNDEYGGSHTTLKCFHRENVPFPSHFTG